MFAFIRLSPSLVISIRSVTLIIFLSNFSTLFSFFSFSVIMSNAYGLMLLLRFHTNLFLFFILYSLLLGRFLFIPNDWLPFKVLSSTTSQIYDSYSKIFWMCGQLQTYIVVQSDMSVVSSFPNLIYSVLLSFNSKLIRFTSVSSFSIDFISAVAVVFMVPDQMHMLLFSLFTVLNVLKKYMKATYRLYSLGLWNLLVLFHSDTGKGILSCSFRFFSVFLSYYSSVPFIW